MRLRNILVLDYVAETREATSKALADAGLNASSAESLESALESLRRHQPDALVISIDTPGLDGHALCEVIHRAHPARSFSIFVVLRSREQDGLEWTETIPDLRVIEGPVTAQKLAG
ncbi:MAG: response regulator [Gammaproteobacteria bacterium]|nr:response regulator [Gammaproteobacteria bacterium]MDH3507291.1 response regulator [Gammaproteobacteria bacterium]